jgi:hypothetical protein
VIRIPPIPHHPLAVTAAIVIATVAAGCAQAPPSVDGLLVASGGPLQVTDGSGRLVAFDGPPGPVIAVTASGGHVVAATTEGPLVTSSGSGGPRTWRDLDVATGQGTGFPLMALSPLGKELAIAVGEPQGASFQIVIAQVGVGTSRSITVERGLNGPPTWIGPGTIAIDVIKSDGDSAIATIDVAGGDVTDNAFAGRVVSATLDGGRLALDDPVTGEVLVGEAGVGGLDRTAQVVHLVGPPGSGVDGLALSPDGSRLAVVRRTNAGLVSIELYRVLERGWTSVRTLSLGGDAPVSMTWLK